MCAVYMHQTEQCVSKQKKFNIKVCMNVTCTKFTRRQKKVKKGNFVAHHFLHSFNSRGTVDSTLHSFQNRTFRHLKQTKVGLVNLTMATGLDSVTRVE